MTREKSSKKKKIQKCPSRTKNQKTKSKKKWSPPKNSAQKVEEPGAKVGQLFYLARKIKKSEIDGVKCYFKRQ